VNKIVGSETHRYASQLSNGILMTLNGQDLTEYQRIGKLQGFLEHPVREKI
jgi:hypothetical protein